MYDVIPEEVLRLVDEFVYSDKVGMLILHKSPKSQEHPQGFFDLWLEETIKAFEMDETDRKAFEAILAIHDCVKMELTSNKNGFDRIRVSKKL